MTKVKICGLSTPEAVQTAVEAGADYIGFVFAPSKRQVTLEQARELATGIPKGVQKVGVFDAPVAGSGQTFDWQKLETQNFTKPFFIAGGLTEDNVADAIRFFNPYAVDVSSGVETNGKKDQEKIKRFIERVKHGI